MNAFLNEYKTTDVAFFFDDVSFQHETSTDEMSYISVVVSACFVNMTQTADEFTTQISNLAGSHSVTYGAATYAVEVGGNKI